MAPLNSLPLSMLSASILLCYLTHQTDVLLATSTKYFITCLAVTV